MIKGEMYTNYTANEIAAQPKLWRDLYAIVYSRQCELTTFLNKALFYEDLKILLVGAGTSGVAAELLFKEKSASETSKKILLRPLTMMRAASVCTPEGNSTRA